MAETLPSSGKVSIPSLAVHGQGQWPAPASEVASVKVDIPEFHFVQDATRLTLLGISLPGKVNSDDTGINWLSELRIKGGDLATGEEVGFTANGLSLALPLQLPFPDKGEVGRLLVGGLRLHDQALGGIKAEVSQNGMGLRVNATHRSLLLPGLVVSFVGEGNVSSEGMTASGTYEIPRYAIAAPFDLGTFSSVMSGLTFDGTVAAKGKLGVNQCGLEASLVASLRESTLAMAARKLTIEGVNVDLALADLVNLRSDPRQRLRFRQATLGDLVVTDGAVDFQIESSDSILLESSSCLWCKGRLDMPSIRFSPSVKAYDLVLYCDRIHFATLLGQLGAATGAVGDGRLNGRIAMHVEKGNLRFDDSFLYSTPGAGGSIRLTGSEQLSAGIPADTVQFTQIDLAREALKDYNYEWARLSISSEGEDLLLGLQLNGKPGKPLPFVYRKDIGGLASVEADSPGSLFQGIRLDVNFRLPINTILDYGSNIQDLLR